MPRARLLLFGLLIFAAIGFGFADGGQRLARILLSLAGPPVAASSATLSEHELEEINAMSPGDQVKRLLERTINHYKGAPEEISKRMEDWTGHIEQNKELDTMTSTAYFSSDLRVRAAALEIWLAEYDLHKNVETVDALIRDASLADERRYFRLSNLGILGNRGIEPEKVFDTLMLYVHDPDPATRSAAINGLALLGTESTIAPLLDAFHNDASHDLRERAACNLADSGMLSRELRQKAVPELIRFSQDTALDDTTKKWVYQALREITQQGLENDPASWANWHAAARN
jgi:HEAT repeat protein